MQRSTTTTNLKFAREVFLYTLILTVYTLAFYGYRQWLYAQKEIASFDLMFWLTCGGIAVGGVIVSWVASRMTRGFTIKKDIIIFEIIYIVVALGYVAGLWVLLFGIFN